MVEMTDKISNGIAIVCDRYLTGIDIWRFK